MVMDVSRCRFAPFYATVTDYIFLFFQKNKAALLAFVSSVTYNTWHDSLTLSQQYNTNIYPEETS
jgi:hypothetical protein